MMLCSSVSAILFLSTPSARRATSAACHRAAASHISIHALREEGDHHFAALEAAGPGISIHALREEGDRQRRIRGVHKTISIHALREEGDSKNRDKISIFKQIIQHSARI